MSHSIAAKYSEREELANMITHGSGVILSAVGLGFMLHLAIGAGDGYRVLGASVFGASMILAYLASTLYHSWSEPRIKKFFRAMDHSSIYLLIAGSYTPFTLILMRGNWGWTLFGTVWAFAVLGIVFKLISTDRFMKLSLALYLGMGWLAVVAAKPMIDSLPPGCFLWILLGGLMYTGGVVFYAVGKIPFNHAIWHLFVMAGSFFHFVAVYWYVLPDEMKTLSLSS